MAREEGELTMRNGSEPNKIHGSARFLLLLLIFVLPTLAACGSIPGASEHSHTTGSPRSGTATPVRLPLQVAPSPTPEPTGLLPTRLIIPKDRKSTRLNSSHPSISYAVFCLKK